MSASQPAFIYAWTVGKRYKLTLSVPFPVAGVVTVATCEWEPHMPEKLNQRERRDYMRGRAKALETLLKTGILGGFTPENLQQEPSETVEPCGFPVDSPNFNH